MARPSITQLPPTGLDRFRGLLTRADELTGGLLAAVPGIGTLAALNRSGNAAQTGDYTKAVESLADVVPVGRLATRAIKGLTKGRSTGDVGGLLNIEKPSYQGEHRAPDKDSGAPLSNLAKGVYPEDVYTHGAQYYGSGQRGEAETFALARQLRGKPESKVTVYRAVPFEKTRDEQIAGLERDMADYMRRKKIPASYSGEGNYYDWASAERQRLQSLPDDSDKKPYPINAGDWVTTSKDYAKEHGLGALGGNFKIVKKTVPAGQLYTSGDSILEFGYDPTGLGIQGGLLGSSTDSRALNQFQETNTPRIPYPSSLTMPDVPTKEQMLSYSKVESVPLSKAVSFQSERKPIGAEAGKDLVQGFADKPLAVRLNNGEYVIYDGNHRTDAALSRGDSVLDMHVIDASRYDPQNAGRKPVGIGISDDDLLSQLGIGFRGNMGGTTLGNINPLLGLLDDENQ